MRLSGAASEKCVTTCFSLELNLFNTVHTSHTRLSSGLTRNIPRSLIYDIRSMHDGKVECHNVEYGTQRFLYSDWLYFLWRGIKFRLSVFS